MKKIFEIEDLCCANCAARMENEIAKLDGVQSVTVAFLTQKLILEANDENFDKILENVIKICKKIEPDCEVIIK